MKRHLIPLVACLAMAACSPGAISSAGSFPTSPAAVASHTAVDEAALRGSEEGYKLLRTLIETAGDAGLLKGGRAVTAAKIDADAFAAVGLVEKAYDAFNSASLGAAATKVADLMRQGAALLKGHPQ